MCGFHFYPSIVLSGWVRNDSKLPLQFILVQIFELYGEGVLTFSLTTGIQGNISYPFKKIVIREKV